MLFLCLFASQSGLIAVSPVLARVAEDLGVSTALAGQLRTITGLVAGTSALLLARVSLRVGVARQLLLGATLLALGSLMSATAPTFALLALAQAPIGVAVGVLTSASTVAAAEWVAPELRARVLSWALIGQPAAWIVGMPLVGFFGERSWRLAWLALPLAAALVAGGAVASRRGEPPVGTPPVRLRVVLADSGLARWLTAELLANTAWAGTLVYAGALVVESYGASAWLTGVLLAVAATSYIAGNRSVRRLPGAEWRRYLIAFGLALAVLIALFGALRSSLSISALLFAAAAYVAGARTMLSSALGLSMPSAVRPALMGARAATMQFGYFAGSILGGVALAVGGYTALGVVLGAVFATAAAAIVSLPRRFPARAVDEPMQPTGPTPDELNSKGARRGPRDRSYGDGALRTSSMTRRVRDPKMETPRCGRIRGVARAVRHSLVRAPREMSEACM